MRRIIIYTGISLISLVFIFSCFAFVIMEINPAKWDSSDRLEFILVWLFANLVIVGYYTYPKTKNI